MGIQSVIASVLILLTRSVFAQTELIVDGGFETTIVAPWQFVGSAGSGVHNEFFKSHSGANYLSMGNALGVEEGVYQAIKVPTNAVVATLGFYWNVARSDDADDTLSVSIRNTNHVPLTQVVSIAGSDFDLDYHFVAFDMTPYIGQTVEIYFNAVTADYSIGFSSFLIDDVSVVSIAAADFPPNDYFTNRTVLPMRSSITVNATNSLATPEFEEPDHAGNAAGKSLWWSWTAPTNGVLTITTAGSSFDTVLAVYTGSSVSNLTSIVANDDDSSDPQNALLTSRVRFLVTAGETCQIAIDGVGGASGQIALHLDFQPDIKPPTVLISFPAANAKLTNSTVTVAGSASDNIGVALVQYHLDNEFTRGSQYRTASGTNSWTVRLIGLAPGLNTIRVRAFDASGNVSAIVSRSFTYFVSGPLMLKTNGNGMISPNLNGQSLAWGSAYTVTAKPGAGYIFDDWTGDVLSDQPVLNFIMRSNLTLQANFIPNPFPAVAGNYQGLFYNTNGPAHGSAGLLTATISRSGGFSAKIISGRDSFSFSGQFSPGGAARKLVFSTGMHVLPGPPLSVSLQLDLSGGDRLTGQVGSTGYRGQAADDFWIADLVAHRATFNATTHPAPESGRFTFAVPPILGSPADPSGAGFGAVTVTPAGDVQLSGVLGDGTKITQKAILSKDGKWAFYVPLYSGNGSDFGWQTFFPCPVPAPTDGFSGEANWTRLPQPASKFYPGGFTNLSLLIGSRYSFTNGVPLLNFTNGLVWLANGDLAQSFNNRIVFATNAVINLETNNLTVAITPSSGRFKGTVVDPFTGRTIPFQGILVQRVLNAGEGLFLGTNRTGLFLLGPISDGGGVGGF